MEAPGPLPPPVVPRARVVPPPRPRSLRLGDGPAEAGEPAETGEATGQPPSRPWTLAKIILGAYVAAVLLRACVFDAYRIPSASMEQTLQPGDFVFVSKLGYGARIPEARRIPFTRRVVQNPLFPGLRLPGLGGPQRGDVAVFHYPPEAGPISERTPYVKRLIGLPGDTVEIEAKRTIVNGDTLAYPETGRQFWILLLGEGAFLPPDTLATVGFSGRMDRISETERLIEGTADVAERFRGLAGVEAVVPLVRRPRDGSAGFPPALGYSLDDWGPMRVPFAGWTIPLDGETWPRYRETIYRHEPAEVVRVAGGFEVDGQPAEQYTFRQSYVFVLGDHRDDSADSRSWGFVPESHLIGRARLVYFSRDPVTGRLRWERIFHGVR